MAQKKNETEFGPEIRKELKGIAAKVTEMVNDYWAESLMEMKGYPITKELVDGLAKISKDTLLKEINKRL